jgi:aerobic C4-dicarboxylate transport protein
VHKFPFLEFSSEGSSVATVVVGKWCKELDVEQMRRRLDQETDMEADAPEIVLDQREERMAISDK